MGQTGIKSKFTGFARIVEYKKSSGRLAGMTGVYDGLLRAGEMKGFGRRIDAETRSNFIGPMDGDYATGKGLYYKDFDPKYIGVWGNSGPRQKYTARPSATFWFDHFNPEPIAATEPEIDPETGIRTWPDGTQTNADGTEVKDRYGDAGDDYNPYLIDEYEEEQKRSEPEEKSEGEEMEGSDAEGDPAPEEAEEECAWDDEECWANVEYDW
jgi:hypothetical protein